MKLLVVDDHELFRQGMDMLLSSQSAIKTVLHAATAAQALQQHSDHPDIDLVLLDYN
ncbi:MAG: response regulator transcription factor, partial [Sphingobacteriales bacterium]